MKKTTKKIVKENITPYEATVKVMGKVYKSNGETIKDAIVGLNTGNCKGKAILTIKHGDISKERILMPTVAFRLFNTKGLANEIALKQASSLFQGL